MTIILNPASFTGVPLRLPEHVIRLARKLGLLAVLIMSFGSTSLHRAIADDDNAGGNRVRVGSVAEGASGGQASSSPDDSREVLKENDAG